MGTTPQRATPHTSRWGSRRYTVPNVEGTGEMSYPSVTTVLGIINKPALVYWAAKSERDYCLEQLEAFYTSLTKRISPLSFRLSYLERLGSRLAYRKISREALDIGRLVHDRIEWEMRSELGLGYLPEPRIPDELVLPDGTTVIHPARQSYESYRRWKTEKRVTPLRVEQVVWSHRYGIAGTLDWVGRVEDRLTLADWKSSKAIYFEMPLQIAAYRQCWIEMGHGEPPLGGLIVRLPKETGDEFEALEVEWEEQEALFGQVRAALALYTAHEQWEAARIPHA